MKLVVTLIFLVASNLFSQSESGYLDYVDGTSYYSQTISSSGFLLIPVLSDLELIFLSYTLRIKNYSTLNLGDSLYYKKELIKLFISRQAKKDSL